MSVSGWIGVDLDGTLAEYHGWNGGKIGRPIPAMANRVRQWLADGTAVKIFTARVGSKDSEETAFEFNRIQDWTEEHFGVRLPVTCSKDFAMVELWDDRCVQVVPNTGQRADGKDEVPK